MKKSKRLLTIIMCLALALSFAACSKSAPSDEDGQTGDPLALVNVEDNGEVSFFCTVNGDWLTGNEAGNKTTRHFIIADDGFNKGKAVLSCIAPAKSVYEAMIEAGFEPGARNEEEFSLENGEKLEEGQKINVTLTWEGQDEPVNMVDCVVLDNGSRPDVQVLFHGNKANFEKNYSGCVTCLDSCFVGITSNCKYGFLNVENNNPNILGDSTVLPDGGTVVKVTFSVAK